ncbi:MAG: serine aminopeptidase domain-containing protein [Saprospiraceae bacterium]
MKKAFQILFAILFFSACQKENITIGLQADDTFYIEHDGASMRVLVRGNTASKTFLIMVHGGPGGSSYIYLTKKIAEIVQPVCAVVYYDQRNAGASQGNINADNYDLNQYADDLRELILLLKARYGQEISLFLMSKSAGGMVASAFMTEGNNQDLTRGWLFVNATHNYRLNDSLTHEMLLRIGREHIASGLNAEAWEGIVDYCEDVHVPFSFQQSLQLNQLGTQAQKIIEGLEPYTEKPVWDYKISEHIPLTNYYLGKTNSLGREFNESLLDIEFTSKLSKVTTPVLVCSGKLDFVCPTGLADDFMANISSISKKQLLFEKSAHNLEEQNAYYLAFVQFVLEHR